MDKAEAIRAMLDGKKVKINFWKGGTYIFYKDGMFVNNEERWFDISGCGNDAIWEVSKEEKRFYIGDVFLNKKTKEYYILARVENNKACLFSLSDGNRFTECKSAPIEADNNNVFYITEEYFNLVCGYCGQDGFEKVEKSEVFKEIR